MNDEQATSPKNLDRLGIAALIGTALLAGAVLNEWSYGYYQFLRLTICPLGVWIALAAHRENRLFWLFFGVGIAILFNPIWQIAFKAADWRKIDFFTGAALAFYGLQRLGMLDRFSRLRK